LGGFVLDDERLGGVDCKGEGMVVKRRGFGGQCEVWGLLVLTLNRLCRNEGHGGGEKRGGEEMRICNNTVNKCLVCERQSREDRGCRSRLLERVRIMPFFFG